MGACIHRLGENREVIPADKTAYREGVEHLHFYIIMG